VLFVNVQNAQMHGGLGQGQRALLGTIADGLAVIDESKAQLQTRAELPPLGTDPVSSASSFHAVCFLIFYCSLTGMASSL